MKKGFARSLASICLMIIANQGMAADLDGLPGLKIGLPAYGGNGCPIGSASSVLNDDSTQLSILFDSFAAEAGGLTGRQLDRKSCNLAIPVNVPQGYSISIIQTDFRGYTNIPRGGEARLSASYFFAGSRGPTLTTVFKPKPGRSQLDEEYIVSDNLVAEALIWSRCGEDVILRVNSSMLAKSNLRNDETLATVDSVDVKSGIIYHIQWKRCR